MTGAGGSSSGFADLAGLPGPTSQPALRHCALSKRMMVAEFVSRQSGSPMNGETVAHEQQQPPPGPQHEEMFASNGSNASSASSAASQSSYELRKELFSQRKQREFIPDNKKDDSYWDRRRRNNEAAKRSREKRRFNDMVLEQRVMELSKENHLLKAQLEAIRDKYNICVEGVLGPEHAQLPPEAGLAKRAKLQAPALLYARSPSPVHTSVIHQTASAARPALRSPAAPLFQQQQQQQQQHQQQQQTLAQQPLAQPHLLQPQQPHHLLGQPPQQLLLQPQQPPLHLQPQPQQAQQQQQQQHQHLLQQQACYELDFSYPHFAQLAPGLEAAASALNLSRRERHDHSPAFSQHELELCSSAGSGDEGQGGAAVPGPQLSANSGLPHKLRHKSRLGDKDAASALLALQGIKQEPPAARASPPWDNEGSSDERDSGISLGAEWPPSQPRPQQAHGHALPESEREVKSRLDRLASEVASLQSILRLGKASSLEPPARL